MNLKQHIVQVEKIYTQLAENIITLNNFLQNNLALCDDIVNIDL